MISEEVLWVDASERLPDIPIGEDVFLVCTWWGHVDFAFFSKKSKKFLDEPKGMEYGRGLKYWAELPKGPAETRES